MNTLKDTVIALKIRKGKAEGITKRGAFWVIQPGNYFAKLRRTGGDGIGQSAPDITYHLELRHFRSGEVRAVVIREAWHQNGSYSGGGTTSQDVSAILDCTTSEEVIAVLKGTNMGESSVCGDDTSSLTSALLTLGMPESLPAPDEVGAAQG